MMPIIIIDDHHEAIIEMIWEASKLIIGNQAIDIDYC